MKRRWNSLRCIQLLFVVALIFSTIGATDNTRFERLGHKLMCQCGCSQVLLECNHVGCQTSEKMRAELSGMITDGGSAGSTSDDSILQKFVDKYGPVVLAAPTQTGFNRVAWIMPYLVLILAVGACAVVVRTWKRRRAPVPVTGPVQIDSSSLDEYRKRVHQETEL